MAGWSSVAFLLLAFAAGWFVCDWRYKSAALDEAERQLVIANTKPAAHVAEERRLVAATDARDRGKERARAGVSAAPALADCPIGDELGSLLVTQQQATRAGTGSGVPNRPVP